MLITSGCGKTGASSLDLNNYTAGNGATPDNENGLNDPFANPTETGNIDSVTISWSAPTLNVDGSPLAGDLAGYIIYYGQDSGNYTELVDIGHITSASVSALTSGTWCFTVTAYDAAGNESDYSEEICKTIS